MRPIVIPGALVVYASPMFGGKTGRLIGFHKLLEQTAHAHVILRPKSDTRSPDVFQSRDGRKASHWISVDDKDPETSILRELNYQVATAKAVLIDEIQLFDEDIVGVIDFLRNQGKMVVVAGLAANYRGEGFGSVPELIVRASQVINDRPVCSQCKSVMADFTQRLTNGVPSCYFEKEVVIEGSAQEVSYEARCLEHHHVPCHPDILYRKFRGLVSKKQIKDFGFAVYQSPYMGQEVKLLEHAQQVGKQLGIDQEQVELLLNELLQVAARYRS